MLAAKEMFFKIENILREQGVLEKFKEENWEITVIWWLRCRKYFLNNEVKLTKQDLIDENIELLVVDGQLKGVVKDDQGSPNVEIVYNVNLSKGDEWYDFVWWGNSKNPFNTKNNIRKSKDASLSLL